MAGLYPLLMGTLSVLYISAFAVSGFFISRLVFPKDRFAKQLLFGMTAGLVMLLWLPVLFAFIMDFTLAAQLISLAAALAAGVLCLVLGRKRARTGGFDKKKDIWLILTALPLVIVGLLLMNNHFIRTASDGSLHVGQCTYGDLCMHLGFITSISVQKSFPPMYSILPDTLLGYPFLCDSVSSTFYTLGASLRFAALLPALYAYISVVLGVYLFFEDWFGRSSSACLATAFFFIGGGFGFAYFFDNAKTYASLTTPEAWENWLSEVYGVNANINYASALDMGRRLLYGWYKTPTNYIDLGLRWVNTIADMLIPQRATLFGWALLFPALQMLRRAAFDREKRLFICLGVLAGAMPLVHTHSFFALGIISAALIWIMFIKQICMPCCGIKDKGGWRNLAWFLLFGAVTMLFASPQLFLFTFKQSSAGGFVKFHLNWCNESDSWLWFYIKNMGLIFILMLPAFLAAKKEHKLFFASVLPIWLICEFVVFQPNNYDNNKLLFVWFAFTCGLTADLIIRAWARLRRADAAPEEIGQENKKAPLGRRLACDLVLAVIIAAATLSGVMTIAREYVSGDHWELEGLKPVYKETGYQTVSPELVEAADWIKQNTAPNDIILTATNHNNAVAMLTGRSIVCGSPVFLFFHGVDFTERYYRVQQMYEDPYSCFDDCAKEYGVDYVLISVWEMGSYNIDHNFFNQMETVWSNGAARILKVN